MDGSLHTACESWAFTEITSYYISLSAHVTKFLASDLNNRVCNITIIGWLAGKLLMTVSRNTQGAWLTSPSDEKHDFKSLLIDRWKVTSMQENNVHWSPAYVDTTQTACIRTQLWWWLGHGLCVWISLSFLFLSLLFRNKNLWINSVSFLNSLYIFM